MASFITLLVDNIQAFLSNGVDAIQNLGGAVSSAFVA